MAGVSVLLVGASGVLGKPLLDEVIRQKDNFQRVAILATPERAAKFDNSGVEVVVGSLYDPRSYKGNAGH